MKTTPNILARMIGVAMVVAACMGGCGSGPRTAAIDASSAMTVSGAKVRGVAVFDGNGKRAGWSDVVQNVAGADVVIIGENHGHPLGLAAAAALWQDVLARSPKAALAMEFIERDEQSRLDDYLAGIADEATFRKKTGRVEGNYPAGHRAMVEQAKTAHRPVIAANAPRGYVRLARTSGYERLAELTAEQKRLFRVPDDLIPKGVKYRDDFDTLMGGEAAHDPAKQGASDQTEAAFRSQQMWDWTMAESVARGCEAGSGPVVLVVGRFHCDFGGGLVQALKRMRPQTRVVVVSFSPEDAPANAMPESDRGRADFVAYVGPYRKER